MSDQLPIWPPPSDGRQFSHVDPYAMAAYRPADGRWRRMPSPRVLLATGAAVALVIAVAVGAVVIAGGGGQGPAGRLASSGAPMVAPTSTTAAPTSATTPLPPTTEAPATTTTAPVATTTLPPALPTQSLVTPAVEQRVVETTWQSFATAFATGDAATIAANSTPAVQQAVIGTVHCGCGGWPVASTVVNYSAPPQKAYPLYFFAELQGQDFNGEALMKEVAFSQSGAGRPWLVSYLGAFIKGSPVFGTDSSQFMTGAASPVPWPLAQAPGQFAAWFQQLDQTGTPPPLPAHWLESNVMKENAVGSQSTVVNDRALGYTDTFSHSIAGTSPLFAIPGGQVVFATLTLTRTVTPPAGHTITQPADRSTWGQLLAPGSYHRLVFHETIDIALGETTSGTIIQLTNLGGPYSITGS